jgi:Subtilase family
VVFTLQLQANVAPGRAHALLRQSPQALLPGLAHAQLGTLLSRRAFGAPALVGPGRAVLPGNHPDRVAQRLLQLVFAPMPDSQASELQRAFMDTGLYALVEWGRDGGTQFHAEYDQLTKNITTDAHHKQWAYDRLNMQPALQVTKGRALLGSIDGGYDPNNPELQANFRAHWSAFDRYDVTGNNREGFDPTQMNQFGGQNNTVAHGMHTSGIMIASLESTTTNAAPGTGIVGICPSCSLTMMRKTTNVNGTNSTDSVQRGFEFLAQRQGVTAINYSGSTSPPKFTPLYTALDSATARDVVLVASAGNSAEIVADIPAAHAGVYGVGAIDPLGHAWSEKRMFDTYTTQQRHPGTSPVKVNERCPFTTGAECGTNIPSASGAKPLSFMAPGAQILSTIDRSYIPFGSLLTTCTQPLNGADLNCDHRPPASNLMGSALTTSSPPGFGAITNNNPLSIPGQNYNYLGSMTGTSQAAPHITALAGLVRSVNPLLSTISHTGFLTVNDIGEVGEALAFGANPVVNAVNDPHPCVTVGGTSRCGNGVPNAQKVLEKTLGRIGSVQLNNRLTPMFQLRNDTGAAIEAGFEETGALSPLSIAEAWLSTTSAQVAMIATEGNLYKVGGSYSVASGQTFGVSLGQAYKAGYQGTNQNHVLPQAQYRHRLWGNAAGQTQLPFASFYLHSTENAPAGTTLLPLYRMSSKCFGIRKHFYTTSASVRDSYAAGPAQVGTSEAGCITGAAASARGYFYDGVEGYAMQTPLPGTVELKIGYYDAAAGSANSGWAIYTADESARFSSYNTNVTSLGYVYPAVSWNAGVATYNDTDADGLSDGYERGMKLNELAADSDCDGTNDGVEFPIAGLSPSDPMQSPTCADLQLLRNATPSSVFSVTLTNVFGPAAASAPAITYSYAGNTAQSPSLTLSVPVAAGWTCQPGVFTYLPQNNFTATRTCTGSSNLSLAAQLSFSVSQKSNEYLPISAQASHSGPDPFLGNNTAQ